MLECIGGANPVEGYSFQFNWLSLFHFYQLCLFMGQPAILAQPATHFIGYGGGSCAAAIKDYGGPDNVFLQPEGVPMAANIPTKAGTADFNAGLLSIRLTYDGDRTFTFDFLDSSGEVVDSISQKFLEPVSMMRMEPVAVGEARAFKFSTGAFRLTAISADPTKTLNALSGESPLFGVDLASGKPVMWSVGTAESSNMETVLEAKTPVSVVLDYLVK